MKVVNSLVAPVGLVVAALGLTGVVSPPTLFAIAKSLLTANGLYAIAALRLAIGAVFFLAAPASRMPKTLRALGVLVFVSGIVTALVGVERAVGMLDWFAGQGPAFMRAMAALALAFGAFVVYVAPPPFSRRS